MSSPQAEGLEEPNVRFDQEKFRDVIHYICASCGSSELGRVKLHKILYFSDMLNYLDYGVPLTGVDYQKQAFGPVARHMKWALDDLERRGLLKVEVRDFFGYPKYDFISLAEPATNRISENERHLIDAVIDFVCARSASEISELSHNAAWETAELGERIPYFTAYGLVPVEITDDDVAWGVSEARRVLTGAT